MRKEVSLHAHQIYRGCISHHAVVEATCIAGKPIHGCTNVMIISFSYCSDPIDRNCGGSNFMSPNRRERNQDENQCQSAESHCYIYHQLQHLCKLPAKQINVYLMIQTNYVDVCGTLRVVGISTVQRLMDYHDLAVR